VDATFRIGDRVQVAGGYDEKPEWLAGGEGYSGTIRDFCGSWATVELDVELELALSKESEGWADFGTGSAAK
jgi:hypothetical protein